MNVKIITDSTTEISQAEAKKLNISVVPLKTIFGTEEYLDGIDMSPDEFYEKLAKSEQLPTTSQPSSMDFERVYKEAQSEGYQIVCICLASSISGTYQSASIAKETCKGDIRVVDSGQATVGVQLLVRYAIRLRDEGKTAGEIADILEEKKQSIHLFAVVDTLEYLYKGGRLSKVSAFAGTLLNMKPIISVHQNKLKAISKRRGLKKAYGEIFQLVEKSGGIDYSLPFAIGYTGDKQRFAQFEDECTKLFGENKPIVGSVGSVIGTHAGPGAVAVAFFALSQ